MSKGNNYFSHDMSAYSDPKILKMRKHFKKDGVTAYGVFWIIVEMLRATEGYMLPIDSLGDIAYDKHMDEKMLVSVVTDFDLFEIEEGHFFSRSLIDRMQDYDRKRSKRSDDARNAGIESGRKRREQAKALKDSEKRTTVERPLNEGSTTANDCEPMKGNVSRGNVSKGEVRIGNEIKGNELSLHGPAKEISPLENSLIQAMFDIWNDLHKTVTDGPVKNRPLTEKHIASIKDQIKTKVENNPGMENNSETIAEIWKAICRGWEKWPKWGKDDFPFKIKLVDSELDSIWIALKGKAKETKAEKFDREQKEAMNNYGN